MKMCEYQLKKNIKGILELQSSQEQERKSLEEKNKLIMEHYKSLYKKDLPNINAYWEHTTQEAAKELAINVEKYTNDVCTEFYKKLDNKEILADPATNLNKFIEAIGKDPMLAEKFRRYVLEKTEILRGQVRMYKNLYKNDWAKGSLEKNLIIANSNDGKDSKYISIADTITDVSDFIDPLKDAKSLKDIKWHIDRQWESSATLEYIRKTLEGGITVKNFDNKINQQIVLNTPQKVLDTPQEVLDISDNAKRKRVASLIYSLIKASDYTLSDEEIVTKSNTITEKLKDVPAANKDTDEKYAKIIIQHMDWIDPKAWFLSI